MNDGILHHVSQRGNRRQQTFFDNENYQSYLAVMSEWYTKLQVDIRAYCPMSNHVHHIAVPETKDGLNLAIGEAPRRYSRRINFCKGWQGHLWQGRFSSFIPDDSIY
jgi:putative transposase